MVFMEGKLQIAPVGNSDRIFKGFITIGKQLPKFLFTLQIKFFCGELHSVGFIHSFAGLHTQQNILHFRVFLPQVVRVICNNILNSKLLREFNQLPIYINLVFIFRRLHFKIEVVFPKN